MWGGREEGKGLLKSLTRFFFFFFQFVSIYAAYLYDAVKLYARALDYLIRQQGDNITEALIDDIASNGTNIIQTIIKNKTYESE